MRATRPLEDRFWTKVIPEPNSGCFLWIGALSKGYGILYDGKKHRKAHRISWEMWHGTIPSGLEVMHKCDNPCCVNPDHLEVGTHKKNGEDASARGLLNIKRGTANYNSRLSESDVEDIRASQETQFVLARRYGVSQSTISRARTWRSYR